MWKKFCGWLLKRMGWTVDNDTIVPEDKCLILGAFWQPSTPCKQAGLCNGANGLNLRKTSSTSGVNSTEPE